MTTDLCPHTRLMLNVSMLLFPIAAQRATALALTRIAGATSDRGTVGMGVLPPADVLIATAYDATSLLLDMDRLTAAMHGLIASGFLSVPCLMAGQVYRLSTDTLPERFVSPDDAPVDYSQGVTSPTYRYGERS
jgi:hypothetical protein